MKNTPDAISLFKMLAANVFGNNIVLTILSSVAAVIRKRDGLTS